MYKIDLGANGNIMPFKIFQSVFPRSMIETFHATNDNTVVLKTYNNSNIEQLDVCS